MLRARLPGVGCSLMQLLPVGQAHNFIIIIIIFIINIIASSHCLYLLCYHCSHCHLGAEGHSMAEEDALPHHWKACSAAQRSAGGV